MNITQLRNFNGFSLKNPSTFQNAISVIIGRNGSGKTRFLNSIVNGSCNIELNETILQNSQIKLISSHEFNPNLGQFFEKNRHERSIESICNALKNYKDNLEILIQDGAANYREVISPRAIYMAIKKIANAVEKNPRELTQEDILLHYTEENENIIGHLNVREMFSDYIRKIWQNKYNGFLLTLGESVPHYNDEEFKEKFGERPWIPLNNILSFIFDGKYHFNPPSETDRTLSEPTDLLDESGTIITPPMLSSGENTLLWMALTLFNSQYGKQTLSAAPKLILMDEPDAFLHPKMVDKLFQTLEIFTKNFGVKIILTTHSPTTVALAPNDFIYLIKNNEVSEIDKDSAISELLSGVTQISIDPENRRQVYVESLYDHAIYQLIYDKLVKKSKHLDKKINLTFISSGPKVSKGHIINSAKFVGIVDEEKLNQLAELINGAGNCTQVEGTVNELIENGNRTVRGVIDWDLKAHDTKFVKVLAKDHCYAIENLIIDPICTLLFLHKKWPTEYPIKDFCEEEVHWSDWIKDEKLLQKSMDYFIFKISGKKNARNTETEYLNGIKLLSDKDYLQIHSKDLPDLAMKEFKRLTSTIGNKKRGLMYEIAEFSMVHETNGDLIPVQFETIFKALQE